MPCAGIRSELAVVTRLTEMESLAGGSLLGSEQRSLCHYVSLSSSDRTSGRRGRELRQPTLPWINKRVLQLRSPVEVRIEYGILPPTPRVRQR
ncbi:hypothetical protein CC2G_013583 [Coprinopsis cinerea AmutBmut pab1-1]|nr:hypothetical protein CC2G_013583 [Coprinopsis cinerea AmutBmut pab1-1]